MATMLSASMQSLAVGDRSFTPAQPRSRRHSAFQVSKSGRCVAISAATPSGEKAAQSQTARSADAEVWVKGAFPAYLQSEVDDFCAAWSDTVQEQDTEAARQQGKVLALVTKDNPVWQAIRHQAAQEAAEEMLLSSFYHASILGHDSFARSLAFVLANRLADATLLATELFEIFHQVLKRDEKIKQAALLDIVAFYERDPACTTYSGALLYFKGYHAIQTHRIGHVLWNEGRKVLALALQARISEVLAIDIHPGAVLGKGLLIDHGTGVVIGETCRIGDNVSIMQNVTLGGTGKTAGNRHPQVANNVLIGAGASVLGNISIGSGAQVAAGSLVLQDVPRRSMVAGSPAYVIGKVTGNAAMSMQQVVVDDRPEPRSDLELSQQVQSDGEPLVSQSSNASQQGSVSPHDNADGSTADGPSLMHASPSSNGAGPGNGGTGPSGSSSSDEECSDALSAMQAGSSISSLSDWALSAASKSGRGAARSEQAEPHGSKRSLPAQADGPGALPSAEASLQLPHKRISSSSNPDALYGVLQQTVQSPLEEIAAASSRQPARTATLERPTDLLGAAQLKSGLALEQQGNQMLTEDPEAEDVDVEVAPSDCEPDWLASSSGLDLVWSTAVSATSDGSDDAAELGIGLWRDMHNQLSATGSVAGEDSADAAPRAAARAAALRRHNNRVLAEAGVLEGAAPWAVLSPFDVAGVTDAAAEAERDETKLSSTRNTAAWAKPAAAVAAARIMNPVPQSTSNLVNKRPAVFTAEQASSDQDYVI